MKNKKRGVRLTFWLVAMLIGNIITVVFYSSALYVLSVTDSLPVLLVTMPIWGIYVMGALILLNTGFVLFVFQWRRWAFFALCGSAGVTFIINLLLGLNIIGALLGLLGPVILYLFLRPKWHLLE